MAEYLAPGVYVEEIGAGPKPIQGVPTATAALLGETGRGPRRPRLVTSFADYERTFGTGGPYLPDAVRGFFANGGKRAFICRLSKKGGLARGLAALEAEDVREVALVAAPGMTAPDLTGALIAHCEAHSRFAVIDCARDNPATLDPRNAACYAPWLAVAAPGVGGRKFVPPSGHMLGIYARTDAARGVWKAPANAVVEGALALEHAIGDGVQELLNPRGVNTIRRFPGRGIRVWGARTLSTEREWQYVSVRRLFLYLAQSIGEGTHWVVFEPNDEPLWASVRRLVENFLFNEWRAGALAGVKANEAFYVRCGRETMTQPDIESGRLICEIGIAPVRPAEYLTIRIGQWTADYNPGI